MIKEAIPSSRGNQHAVSASTNAWEDAYTRFETADEEIEKFSGRLRRLGAADWPRDSRIVELFCGRGNGLHALSRLGFRRLEGVDLSQRLLSLYRGPASVCACDCRELPFASRSRDILIVQGGLHHLPVIPESLEETFVEIGRVLKIDGRLVIVEPWLTPFLKFVHRVSELRLARRTSVKIDALATMIEHERETYERWLHNPDAVLQLTRKYFKPLYESFGWGKWSFVGTPLVKFAVSAKESD